jgi:hypothetical protein
MAKKMSAMDMLKGKASATPSKKKAKKAKPQISLKDLDAHIAEWRECKEKEKEAKSRRDIIESEILPVVEEAKAEHCQSVGAYDSTVEVNGKIAVTQAHKYSAINLEDEELLQKMFGEDFEKFFVSKTSVSFSEALLNNEERLQEVLTAIQEVVDQEEFAKFFKVEYSYAPTEAYHKGRITNPEIREKAKMAESEDIIKPYKPTVKLVK